MMPQSMLTICLVFGICVGFDSAGASAGAPGQTLTHEVALAEVDQKRNIEKLCGNTLKSTLDKPQEVLSVLLKICLPHLYRTQDQYQGCTVDRTKRKEETIHPAFNTCEIAF